uniref:Putative wings apart-like protein regulation of heterochromatin n=1 Tax=Anopheles triannulatus TaxID=58253 RepID=A0A2M4A8E3_9DIPT
MLISTDSEDVSSNSASAPVASDYQPQKQQPSTVTGNSETTTVDQYVPAAAHYHSALARSDVQSPRQQQHHQPLHDEPYQHRYAEEALIGEQQQLEQPPPANSVKEVAVSAVSVPVAVPKTDLKIKISLGGKPMVGATTSATSATTTSSPTAAGASPTVGSTSATGSGAASSGKVNKACRYNFKKRAIEQERARNHLSSKRSRAASTAPTEPKAQGEVAEWFEQTPTAQQQPETAAAPSALFQPSHSATGSSTATAATRPVFPLPGTDTYEVFRTLSSLSGGEDFDSQSSILGSASSDNNTPKHTLPAGEGDHQNHHQQQQPHCQIIHSRGSSDCGSDLELSQNSSTVAAPPSDACSENENTQDINPRPPLATAAAASSPVNPTRTSVVMATTTPLVATGNTESPPPPVVVPPQPATERVEVLKLSLKNVSNRSGPTYSRVTRNKTKTPGTEGAATETIPLDAGNVSPQSLRSSATVTRSVRSRATNNNSNHNNNNNNTVVGSIAVVGSGLETTIKAKKAAKGNANVTAASNGGGAQKKVVQQQEQPQEQRQVSDEFELPLKPPGHGALSGNLGGDGMLKPKTDAQSEVQPTEKSLGSTGNVAATTTTRQYSRRKKNVVPPDYLPEPSSVTLPAEPMHEQQDSGVLDLGMNRGLGCGSDLENKSITTTSAAQLMGDLSTAPLSEQQSMDGNGGGGGADGGTVDEIEPNSTMQTVAANSAALQPPAPMRLVLQKKGSIFKSRPLVGSSDGAPEAKKRHVYKHKWDDDDEGNGSGRIRENRSCSTAVVASSDGAEGLDLATSGSSAGIAGNIVSSGCTSGIGGSSGVGAIAGEMLLDPCAPITGEGTVGTGATSAVVSGSVVGCGTAGADAGTGTAESNGDLLECDASLNSLPGGLGPRAKRPNKQASSGGVGLGAGGSGGSCASGVGAAASGTNSNCFGVDAGFGGPNGLPGMNSGGGSGGSSNSGGYHYPAGSAQPYDSESAGFGGDWDDYGGDEQMPPKIRCYRDSKPFYTIVRNVKNSHQMQEIGEFQEMDDDVEYILSALQPDNPVSTRCLSALQLATKCMKPAFKMHVRAHGVVTRFFRALSDAHQDAGLALCTAAIMYVFSQDKLNMDLDRDSLELMLNLLGTTSTGDQMAGTVGKAASDPQQKIRQRVKELCEEIKGSGKAKPHIIGNEGDESSGSSSNSSDGHQISAATLAMESLLSLTSQRAGEWFKDELRKLGGIEHLIKTVSECYESVPERAADWHPEAIAKLRKIERCLRVLNNVCVFNRANQAFLLEHRDGLLVQLLARIYRQLDREIPFHSTDDHTPKEAVGVVVRELHQPILHMLITLTHSFDDQAPGATLVGQQPEMIDITMRILLRIARYVPSRCVFDLHLLALTFLLHLARPSEHNRQQILCYKTAEGKQSGIKELVEYFEQQEEMASHAEAKTNAILETPARTVDTEDTETRLIQKAEHHMEHTYMGSHVCMLIFYLIADQPSLEQIARAHLLNGNFKRMVAAMSRYYEFLNLTTNADAESTAHKRQTKKAIDYLSRLDGGVCEASTSLPNSIILPTPS